MTTALREKRTVSSAYSMSQSGLAEEKMVGREPNLLRYSVSQSDITHVRTQTKRKGERGQPCRTPLPCGREEEVACGSLTLKEGEEYRASTALTKDSGTPSRRREEEIAL